jgi:hypothetical protein
MLLAGDILHNCCLEFDEANEEASRIPFVESVPRDTYCENFPF